MILPIHQPSSVRDPDLWGLFHRQWTRDVGRDGYNKEDWKQLEHEILKLVEQRARLERETTNGR